jgi:hypothetical protein
MGKFIDSFGQVVRHGDTVEIQRTYGGHCGQGQRCRVTWDSKGGVYEYTFRVGNGTVTSDFASVHQFRKIKPADL